MVVSDAPNPIPEATLLSTMDFGSRILPVPSGIFLDDFVTLIRSAGMGGAAVGGILATGLAGVGVVCWCRRYKRLRRGRHPGGTRLEGEILDYLETRYR